MWRNLRTAFKKYQNIFIAPLCVSSLSCSNQFESFADKTNDQALFYSAKEYIREANYSEAIEACSYMSTGFLTEDAAAEVCASAYAGRCGFLALDMVDALAEYAELPAGTRANTKLFEWFLTEIPLASGFDSEDCNAAETLIRSLGAASVRTDDQNSFMVLLSLRTIAQIADETADIAAANGVVDVGFDVCAMGATQSQNLGSAIWELDKSLDALSSNTYYTAMDTLMDAICTGLATAPLSQDLCGAVSPLALGAAQLKGARTFLKEGAVLGIDQANDNGTIATNNCP